MGGGYMDDITPISRISLVGVFLGTKRFNIFFWLPDIIKVVVQHFFYIFLKTFGGR